MIASSTLHQIRPLVGHCENNFGRRSNKTSVRACGNKQDMSSVRTMTEQWPNNAMLLSLVLRGGERIFTRVFCVVSSSSWFASCHCVIVIVREKRKHDVNKHSFNTHCTYIWQNVDEIHRKHELLVYFVLRPSPKARTKRETVIESGKQAYETTFTNWRIFVSFMIFRRPLQIE